MNAIKKAKVESCKYVDDYLHPVSKKYIYYHQLAMSNGDLLSCGTMEKNSPRIKVGSVLEYKIDDKGKMKIETSSNDKKPEPEVTPSILSPRIKGHEAFLGYTWSYSKDLIIAGKTMEDVEELNKIARYIYAEIGKMLQGE